MTKYTYLHNDYYLQVSKEVSQQDENLALISLFDTRDSTQFSKFVKYISFDGEGSQPWVKYFGSYDLLVRFFREKDNYHVEFNHDAMICLKWEFRAKNYAKNLQTQIFLEHVSILQRQFLMISQKISRKSSPNKKNQLNQNNSKIQLFKINSPKSILRRKKDASIKKSTLKKGAPTLNSKINRKQQSSSQRQQYFYSKQKHKKTQVSNKTKQINKQIQTKKKNKGSNSKMQIKKERQVDSPAQQLSRTQLGNNKFRLVFANGDYYEGELQNNDFNGFGFYYSVQNGTYEGMWKDGLSEGQGITIDQHGNILTGTYTKDKRFGWGIDQYYQGSKYQGNFKANDKCGWGKYTEPDGSFYQGYWKQNLSHGKVKYYCKQDQSTYLGEWKYDKKDGKGILCKSGKTLLQKWKKGKLVHQQQISQEQKKKFERQFNLTPPK